jgi:protein ImuB
MKTTDALPAFAVLCLPDFALQAVLRTEPTLRQQPAALVDHIVTGGMDEDPDARRAGKARVLQLTAAARKAGVAEGMTANQARARCGALSILPRSLAAEDATQAALLECAFRISSHVESTAPGTVTLAVQTAASARGAMTAASISALVQAHLGALHLEGQAGFGPTPDLAAIAARVHPGQVVGSAADLAEFPLATLDPAPALLELWRRWGIRTVGEFTHLGREEIVRRLGMEAGVLFDRASGGTVRPLRCTQPAEDLCEGMDIEHGIEALEPLLFLLRRLLERLVRRVEVLHRVLAEIRLDLGLRDGSRHERRFQVPSPTSRIEPLFRMLHTHLEGLATPQPITQVTLGGIPAWGAHQQFDLFATALRDPNQFAETLARLAALLGPERIGTPVLEPSHQPDAFHMQPADFTAPVRRAEAAALPLGLSLRRFRPALSALVQSDRGPRYLHAEGIRGAITAAYGPMLLSGDWWSPQAWSRAEWDIRLSDGRLARIYEQEGAWFLEGLYD